MSNEHFMNLGLTSQISSPVPTYEDGREETELDMKGVTKISNSMAQPIPRWVKFKQTYIY